SNNLVGGGFLYTNKESVSVGMVMTVTGMCKSDKRLPDMMEDFRNSNPVRPFLEGGKLIEYSAHLVPEGGINMIPTLYADNVLVLGDTAGFCLNMGYTVRGMDYAIGSAECAAQTVIEAKERGDYSSATLSGYKTRLENSFVMQDMITHKHAPHFVEHTPNLFNKYPELIQNVMLEMFTVNGPSRLMAKKALPHVMKAGLFSLAKDGLKGARAI
ncbi:MAG: FAD-dependent oxidoreductase, partial [Deltaproteobacteria bacterium]|nr:FAD-dependent oxidoreductase [Deltaproteobacteria bacterium]